MAEILLAASAGPILAGEVAVREPTPGAQRIVSLVPSVTEILFALGARSRVVGVSDFYEGSGRLEGLARVGSYLSPVVEVILALEPDLVVTTRSPGNRNAVEAIERAQVKVLVLGEGTIADVRGAITRLALAVASPEAGRRLLARFDAGLDQVRERVSGRPRPEVAVVVGREPLVLAGGDSFLGELVTLAGGRNISEGLSGLWPHSSIEYLLVQEPQVIVDVTMAGGRPAAAQLVKRWWSRYKGLPAVEKGRVYGPASSVLLRPGPRIPEAALLMARMLHPEAWSVKP